MKTEIDSAAAVSSKMESLRSLWIFDDSEMAALRRHQCSSMFATINVRDHQEPSPRGSHARPFGPLRLIPIERRYE